MMIRMEWIELMIIAVLIMKLRTMTIEIVIVMVMVLVLVLTIASVQPRGSAHEACLGEASRAATPAETNEQSDDVAEPGRQEGSCKGAVQPGSLHAEGNR